jgi:hypothetical protein
MPGDQHAINRATFIARAGGMFAVAFINRSTIAHVLRPSPLEHPEPREGITGENVLAASALSATKNAKVRQAYEDARNFPAIFDGVACTCSCGGKNGMHRSLLVCFEGPQATGCGACQEEGEIVGEAARAGKTLADARAAIDKWAR